MTVCPLYEHPAIQTVTGETIRPGGFTLTDRAARICKFPAGAAILDVGCGMGATTAHLRKKHQANAFGADPSPILANQGTRLRPRLPLLRAEAESLPFGDRSLDAVFCECVISLVKDPRKALSEFHRILRRGGWLAVSDIYLKKYEGPGADRGWPATSCLDGAVPMEDVAERVTSAGFDMVLWEDHSRLLAELTAQLIFEHGSLAEFWNRTGLKPAPLGKNFGCSKPGYFLLIARKG